MDGAKVIKQLMLEHGLSINDLAERLGIQPQSVRNKLNRNSFTLSEFEKCLSALDATLFVRLNGTEKIFM